MSDIETLIEDFTFLDDWEDRYRYVIELGRELGPLDDADRSDQTKVQGCVSQVWLKSAVSRPEAGDPHLSFTGDSDALIVKGLIAILFRLYNGQSARYILEKDAVDVMRKIGLHEHLTPQRSNGLASMVQRIKSDAAAAMAA